MTFTPATDPDLSYLDIGEGRRVALRYRGAAAGQPTILFLPGYGSDMEGMKAVAIDQHCGSRGLGCLRIDYSGTGSSPGDFADGTLDRWLDEVLAAVDLVLTDAKVIVVGSSMGAWLALHAALRRPARVAAFLGIAAAPDFTEWGFATEEEKEILVREGSLERRRPDGSTWLRTRALWQSGRDLVMLDAPIVLPIPIRLVHGADDTAVPSAIAMRLFDRLESLELQLRLIKGAGHNLSEPGQISAILSELDQLVECICTPMPDQGSNE